MHPDGLLSGTFVDVGLQEVLRSYTPKPLGGIIMEIPVEWIAGTLMGVLTLWLTWQAGRQTEREAQRQQLSDAHQSISDWQRDFRDWASAAIDVLAEASYVTGHVETTEADCRPQLLECRHQMSALIDRGRLFLPNQPAAVGQNKPKAYRGWRHAALDPLVAAERILSGEVGPGRFESKEAALIAMRREFVSSVQGILAPEIQNQVLGRLILEAHKARSADPTLGGLLPGSATAPTGADRLLWGPDGPPKK